MPSKSSFAERLAVGPTVLLDGPTGTELQRRGVNTDVPGWSAAALLSAPQVVEQIHRDYVAAGAEVLTANTFRTHPRNLAAFGAESRAAELNQLAVDLARAAANFATERPVWVAGSQAPIGDCYEPNRSPDGDALEREHRILSRLLADAGVDLILVETHPTLVEALAATRAALSTELPVVTSFVCNRQGQLLSGEPLAEAARQAAALPVSAIMVNCILAEDALAAVQTLRDSAGSIPVGVYANVGYLTVDLGWQNGESRDPVVYARHAEGWLQAGARCIGSCCSTTPAHLYELRRLIEARQSAAITGN